MACNEVWLHYAIAIQKNEVVAARFFDGQVQYGCLTKATILLPEVQYGGGVIWFDAFNEGLR